MSRENLTVEQVNAITGDDIAYWIGNPFMTPDLLIAKVCWWMTRAATPTPVPSEVAETTAGERDRTFLLPDDCDCLPPYADCTHGPAEPDAGEVEALTKALADIREAQARRADWWDDKDDHALLLRVLRGECAAWAGPLLASDWLAACVAERVRVVEGERDAARVSRDDEARRYLDTVRLLQDRKDEATARAESAEAAHRALQAAVEALADEWDAVQTDAYQGHADRLRALLAGGEER